MKRLTVALMLGFLLVSAAGRAQNTQDATKLMGSWKLMKAVYGGRSQDLGKIVKIKNVTDSQFIWFVYKVGSSTIIEAGGGPYSIQGDTYLEQLEYGLGPDFKVVKGHSIPLKWAVEGDRWHISGALNNGLQIVEDWQKLPSQQVGH